MCTSRAASGSQDVSCPAESSELRRTCLPAGLFKQARETEPRWEKAFFGLADYQDCLYQDARARQESRRDQRADRLMGKGRWVCLISGPPLRLWLAEGAVCKAAEAKASRGPLVDALRSAQRAAI